MNRIYIIHPVEEQPQRPDMAGAKPRFSAEEALLAVACLCFAFFVVAQGIVAGFEMASGKPLATEQETIAYYYGVGR